MHEYQDTFHRAIFPVMFVAQVFGLLPVQGISSSNVTSLKFKWVSFRVFHSCLVVGFGLCLIFAEISSLLLVRGDPIIAKNCGKFIEYLLFT